MMNQMRGKILQEIMDLMDEENGKKLLKHPKLVAAKVTIAKPVEEMPQKDEEMDVENEPGEGPEHELAEGPKYEGIEDILESLSEDKKAKLLALLK